LKKKQYILMTIFVIITLSIPVLAQEKVVETRDALHWPFSQKSIWNMPIGSNARYVHAHLEPTTQAGITIDEDYIVMTPTAPLMDIFESDAGWDKDKDRCEKTGKLMYSLPIPQNFVVNKQTWDGATPNAGLAVLMPDGRTVRENQPFAHCSNGAYATSFYQFPNQDIQGDGYYGAHGASGLSAIGGTLRIGELTPESGPIRHALKINVWGAKNLYYDSINKGFRWPAGSADGYASSGENAYGKKRTSVLVKECRMGALLAIPSSIKIMSLKLETQPAKILAQTFQDYGAYIVDDTAWNVNALMAEWGPDGRFKDEFKKNWGFDFVTGTDTPWGRDMMKIFAVLYVVDNNTSETIGGGGKPRRPLAPKFR
jgi:hypothetical protein